MIQPIQIEFFHDVICSFCFPMSYQMRKLSQQRPELEIVHRSFLLSSGPEDYVKIFGSQQAAKKEIVSHWGPANALDELHRFNSEGMLKTEFPFPSSPVGLQACKSAYYIAGQTGYWDMFDALQTALFEKSQNIEDEAVILACVQQCGLDVDEFKTLFSSEKVRHAIQQDLELAQQYDIHSVPCLVINGKHMIQGALKLEDVETALKKVEEPAADGMNIGESCSLGPDGWHCD